jgi:transmembrane sensor
MNSAADIEAQAAGWLARKDAQNWSAADQAGLQTWLEASLSNRVAYLRLESCWHRADRLSSMHAPGKRSVPARALARFPVWRMAAGVLLLCGAGLLGAVILQQRPAIYQTAVGESRPLKLADGSSMLLNTNTHVHARVDQQHREVTLDSGEAYFEVAHDAAHPFVVDAGPSRITVLGTRFSVRRDGNQVVVAVVDGRVRIESATQAGAGAVLTRDDVAMVAQDKMTVKTRAPGQVANQLGWRQGKLFLDQMTLAQAASEFNRYNRVQLIIADADVGRIRIGGSFNVGNVAGFAQLLQQGFGLEVDRTPEQIRVTRAKLN